MSTSTKTSPCIKPMSPERQAELQVALARLNAEWIAFQRAHKILPKPPGLTIAPASASKSASLPYGQNSLWSTEDHKRESDRMEFASRNNRKD